MRILTLKDKIELERQKNERLKLENIKLHSDIDYLSMMCGVALESHSVMRMSLQSPQYQKVNSYYLSGLWDIMRVQCAVEKGWITQEEFEKIISQKILTRSE